MKRTADALSRKLSTMEEMIIKKVCVLKFACWKVFFPQVVVLVNRDNYKQK